MIRARLKLNQDHARLLLIEHMHDLLAEYGSTYQDILMDETAFIESFVEWKQEIGRPPTEEEIEDRKRHWKRSHPKSKRRKFDDEVFYEHTFDFADLLDCATRKRGNRPILCNCCKED